MKVVSGGPFGERNARAGLLAALLIGAFLLTWRLADQSLFTDEAYTFFVSSLPPLQLVRETAAHDFHPPAFYLATHELLKLGWHSWDYRYLMIPFGLLTIAAVWGLAARLFGGTAGVVAALLTATAPALVQWERIYRMYAPLVALSTVSWFLLVIAANATGRRRFWYWAAYAAAAAALGYVHFLGWVMLGCQTLYALTRARKLWPALIGIGIAVLTFSPWLFLMQAQRGGGGPLLAAPILDLRLLGILRNGFWPGLPLEWVTRSGFDAVLGAIALSVLAAAAWLGRSTVLPFWLLPLPLQLAASIVAHRNFIFFDRYLIYLAPAIATAVGVVAGALLRSPLRVGGAALALTALTINVVAVMNLLAVPYYQFPDWYAVNALILRHERPHDRIVLDEGYEYFVVRNYTAFAGRDIDVFMRPEDFPRVLKNIELHSQQRVWYVQHQNYYDRTGRIERELAGTRSRVLTWSEDRAAWSNSVYIALYNGAGKR